MLLLLFVHLLKIFWTFFTELQDAFWFIFCNEPFLQWSLLSVIRDWYLETNIWVVGVLFATEISMMDIFLPFQ